MPRSLLACALVLSLVGTARAKSSEQPENAAPLGTEQTFIDHSRFAPFWFGAEVNSIFQSHPSFTAPYSGTNSLRPGPEADDLGPVHRLPRLPPHRTTELILDPEMALGGGLSQALGIAGFTNLDVVRNPTLAPRAVHRARSRFTRSSRCRDEWEPNDDRGPISSFTLVPRHRLEFRVGKLSTVDLFDINPAGTDSHLQFMNWTVDNNGAYDYAADTRGYTYGLVSRVPGPAPRGALRRDADAQGRQRHRPRLRLHARPRRQSRARDPVPAPQPSWRGTLRAARLREPRQHGQLRRGDRRLRAAAVDARPTSRSRARRPGQVRRRRSTSSRSCGPRRVFARPAGTTATSRASPTPRSTTPSRRRRPHRRHWRRPDDRIGLAFVTNGLSDPPRVPAARRPRLPARRRCVLRLLQLRARDHRRALLQRARLARASLAEDIQLIANPGYNADRGPVWVFSLRGHLEL